MEQLKSHLRAGRHNVSFISHIPVRFLSCVISLIHVRFLSCVITLIHVRFLSCVISLIHVRFLSCVISLIYVRFLSCVISFIYVRFSSCVISLIVWPLPSSDVFYLGLYYFRLVSMRVDPFKALRSRTTQTMAALLMTPISWLRWVIGIMASIL